MAVNTLVKRLKKESLLFKEIALLFMQASQDDKNLKDIFISRIKLSPDKGLCTVFFYTNLGEDHFNQILSNLILYKPSLRKEIASRIYSRRVPDLVFKFDLQFEKHNKIEELLDRIKLDNINNEN